MATDHSITFSLIIILILVVIVYATYRVLCATGSQLEGYWTAHTGDLFEIVCNDDISPRSLAPQNGGYSIITASGYLGADSDKVYPLKMRGCRSIEVRFPAAVLKGKVGLDRRRIIWERAPTWYRQGV